MVFSNLEERCTLHSPNLYLFLAPLLTQPVKFIKKYVKIWFFYSFLAIFSKNVYRVTMKLGLQAY